MRTCVQCAEVSARPNAVNRSAQKSRWTTTPVFQLNGVQQGKRESDQNRDMSEFWLDVLRTNSVTRCSTPRRWGRRICWTGRSRGGGQVTTACQGDVKNALSLAGRAYFINDPP